MLTVYARRIINSSSSDSKSQTAPHLLVLGARGSLEAFSGLSPNTYLQPARSEQLFPQQAMAPSNPFLEASLICLLVGLAVQKASGACYGGAASVNAFWVPIEGREDMSSSGLPILLTGSKTKHLLDANGTVIALVSELTFQKCKEEGSCYLQQRDSLGSSLLVSYVGGGNVFRRLNTIEFPFGAGAWNKVLEMFVSVATSDFAPDTRLYIKELDGLDLNRPLEDHYRTQLHNGCVRVDDVGSGDCSLGFFTGFYKHYKGLRSSLPSVVHPRADGDCSILQYM